MTHNYVLAVCLAFAAVFCCRADNAPARYSATDRHKCLIEKKQYDVEITQPYTRKITVTNSLLITGREGTRYATVGIGYQKGDKVQIHYAHIEDMQGNVIRKLKNSEVEETQDISSAIMYSDHFIKHFKLLHNSYPYRIVYSYSVTQKGYLGLLNYQEGTALCVGDAVVSLTVPAGAGGIDMRYENVAAPEVAESDGTTKYTWRYSYDPLPPEYWPHEASLGIPKMTVNSDNFEYGVKGSLATWESYGNWLYALNEGLDELPGYEKAVIDNMLDGVDDDLEKMKILYYYLQDNHRYINVSMDIGGHKSHPASYVCANRYGDCKALTTHMKAMLKYIGIESHYAFVWLGEDYPEMDEDFPDANSFNHVINVVPYKGDTIFLECTSKINPFGYVHSDVQGRKALLGDGAGSRLMDIPAYGPEDVKCLYNYNINIDAKGTAAIHIENKLHGGEYEMFNEIASSLDKTSAEKYIRDRIYSGTYELLDYGIAKPDRGTAEVTFSADLNADGASRLYGKTAVITNFPIYFPTFEHPSERRTDLEILTTMNDEYLSTYDMPFVEFTNLPEPVKIVSEYGTYTAEYSYSEGKLSIRKTLLLHAGTHTLAEYSAFYDFISRIRKTETQKLTLNIL